MGLSRRKLLKAGAITGVGGLLVGREGLAGRRKRKKKGRNASNSTSDSDNTGADSLVTFSGSKVTYEPFTQTFELPRILGYESNDVNDAIDPSDGTLKRTPTDPGGAHALSPAPGAPGARLGSDAVYHGIAPEYSRANPTHEVANRNDFDDPPDPEEGDCQHLTAAYPWDQFDHPEDKDARNQEPWERSDPEDRSGEVHYALEIRNSRHEWAPGVVTDILAYRDASGGLLGDAEPQDPVADPSKPNSPRLSPTGEFPAPTILARQGQAGVIRVTNNIQFRPPRGSGPAPTECSVHLHGDHTPAHSDGYPDFYILPDKARDYYYPNVGPREEARPVLEEGLNPTEIAEYGNLGHYSLSDLPTTMWYHEHGMDITGYLVSQGLAGFYLVHDEHEIGLTATQPDGTRKLPKLYAGQDIPMALMDQVIDLKEEILPYDFFDHNGRLGNVFSVNGKLQPYFKVGKGKYRFRFLNASNARIYHLAMKPAKENAKSSPNELDFVQIGQDTWELDTAVDRSDFTIAMAQRVDVIVDFSDFEDGDVVWLNNVMEQRTGRKPKGIDFDDPTPLVKFIVDADMEVDTEITVEAGDPIRCYTPIEEDDVIATRYFTFVRRNGAWQINNQFFSPRTTNATPILNSAERWVFKNKAGGWWHPIHIHLEAHEIQKYNGIPRTLRNGEINPKFPPGYVNNVDVSVLEGGGETEFLMKFRTFTGPFVFHCHNLEHEDMRMMHVFDPRPAGEPSLNDGERAHNSYFSADGVASYREVSGMVESETDDLPETFFDKEGDVEILDDRNVGIPADDFPESPVGQIDPGPPGPDAPDNHDD